MYDLAVNRTINLSGHLSNIDEIIRVLIRQNKAYSAEKSEISYYFTELALLLTRCSLKQDI